jgi:selenide,water dikinase
MQRQQTPIVKDLVLVGGGHSHITVLKQFGMHPIAGVRLTVISRDVHTPYSGMLPGFLAGHYGYDDVHIDLGPLSHFAGARLYHDEVIGLDLANRMVRCRQHPDVSYDVLSLNIGSTPDWGQVPGADQIVIPVKPINTFVHRWEHLVTRVLAAPDGVRIGVVGAGVGGVELTLAMQFRLQHMLRDAGRTDTVVYHLFSGSPSILPTHNRRVQAKLRRVLAARGVQVHEGCQVVEVYKDGLRCVHRRQYELEEILWVTGAAAPAWLAEAGLAVDDHGFVRVNAALQSVSHTDVFAAGDVAAVAPYPREKAGVIAVRQGKPLTRNLRRFLTGRAPRPFAPQRTWLALISTGDQYAIASRGSWSVEGRWVWRWKDWIDRRFVHRYNVLPTPPAE